MPDRGRSWVRSVLAVSVGLSWAWCVLPVAASPEDAVEGDPAALVEAHLGAREAALGRQREAARSRAREQALLAYRLLRRRELGFFADTQVRPQQAHATTLALTVLRRSLREEDTLRDELSRVSRERAALAVRPPSLPPREPPPDRLTWPTKGTVIAGPGLKADPVTGVVVREPGVKILSRVDAPVVVPADGEVRRVESLPSGGYAVVLSHVGGMSTVLSGLRDVDVKAGEQVSLGARLGRVGRTLDGAPVVRWAVWRGGQPFDPRSLLREGR